MKGVAKYELGPGNVKLMDFEEPTPGPGQVKILVKEAGICGSDIHIWHQDIYLPMKPPFILGHEFSGDIVEVGEGVNTYKVGDRVVATPGIDRCNLCDYCRDGSYGHCLHGRSMGYWYNGTFAKYLVVPERNLYKIPDNVSYTAAALTEPLACAVHGVCGEATAIKAGDTVLVTGPGTLGLMAAQTAKAQGAKVLISGTSVDTERLALAKELGIDITIDVQKEDLKQVVMDHTGGYGVDVVVECSGTEAGINSSVGLTRHHGRYIQVGLPGKPIMFNIEIVVYKDLIITGPYASRQQDFRRALKLLENGLVKTEPLVTHKYKLSEWEEAFHAFEKKEGIKLVFVPEE